MACILGPQSSPWEHYGDCVELVRSMGSAICSTCSESCKTLQALLSKRSASRYTEECSSKPNLAQPPWPPDGALCRPLCSLSRSLFTVGQIDWRPFKGSCKLATCGLARRCWALRNTALLVRAFAIPSLPTKQQLVISPSRRGHSALHVAASFGRLELAAELLAQASDAGVGQQMSTDAVAYLETAMWFSLGFVIAFWLWTTCYATKELHWSLQAEARKKDIKVR